MSAVLLEASVNSMCYVRAMTADYWLFTGRKTPAHVNTQLKINGDLLDRLPAATPKFAPQATAA